MSVFIKGLNIKPCKDGFDGKGLVIIGYDDKLYAVAHEQIIPLPDADEFAERMRMESAKNDEEIAHIGMDDAMCELLEKLGYGEAVKIFEDTAKWYA